MDKEAFRELEDSYIECGEDNVDIPAALNRFAQRVLACLGREFSETEDIFSKSLPHPDRRFLAAALIRLIGTAEAPFSDVDFRTRTIALVDEVLASELYPRLSIEAGDQTVQKLSKLRGAEREVLRALSDPIAQATALSSIPDLRQRFMRAVNSPAAKALAGPFLPPHLMDLKLNEIFRASIALGESEAGTALNAFQECTRQLDDFVAEASEWMTPFAAVLVELALKLRTIVEEFFNSSPLSKPADLRVEIVEKKYPLHEVGQSVPLQVRVVNAGEGHAQAVNLIVLTDDSLAVRDSELYVGDLARERIVELNASVDQPSTAAQALISIEWDNFDESHSTHEYDLIFPAQRTDVPWEQLGFLTPYSLEPVSSDEDLVGRNEILGRLVAATRAEKIGSFWLYGQKRVGKTSIARTLETHLRNEQPSPIPLYLEAGEFSHPDPQATINNLLLRLVQQVRLLSPTLADMPAPQPDGSLAPLASFLNEAAVREPHLKLLFILDEFDELPLDLLGKTEWANSFFLTIRSISGKDFFGFVLVGGEKMEYVLAAHGDVLNRFETLRVDYFDHEQEWSDFSELVRRPTADWFEISSEAIEQLFIYTAGNPFFAKLICAEMFRNAVERRDSHVTGREMNSAKRAAVRSAGSNRFQHFWTDAILEPPARDSEISTTRRRLLLALADCKRDEKAVNHPELWKRVKRFNITESTVDLHLAQFAQRKILVRQGDEYACKIPMFQDWLIAKGPEEIATTFDAPTPEDLDLLAEARRPIDSRAVVELVDRWGTYRGEPLSEDRVRAWLQQFQTPEEQRLMFELLKGIDFYGGLRIRELLANAHEMVRRALRGQTTQLGEEPSRRQRRADLVVSYLDSVAKSGARFARLYANENNIYVENVIEKGELLDWIASRAEAPRALAFIDDFIGSGESLTSSLDEILHALAGSLRARHVPVVVVTLTGFASKAARIEDLLQKHKVEGRVHISEPLADDDRCFAKESRFFRDPSDRKRAKDIAHHYGIRLEKKHPLGYKDTEAAVVFDDRVPNNSLPILWSKSSDWRPLFPRH